MNLEKLFDLQRKLDEHIEKEKGLTNQRLFHKKRLALRTELGELANELPTVFKFWSNKQDNMEKALVEYIDGFHFVLSLTLEGAGRYIDEIINEVENSIFMEPQATIIEFDHVYKAAQFVIPSDEYFYFTNLINRYISLGRAIGFTWEQVEEAYMSKNAENHARQDRGY